jgi:hypothetical protein
LTRKSGMIYQLGSDEEVRDPAFVSRKRGPLVPLPDHTDSDPTAGLSQCSVDQAADNRLGIVLNL